jgi:branched-chain amino acid transport system substrate-binding protein
MKNRLRCLDLWLAAGLTFAMAGGARAQAPEPVTIGVLTDMSNNSMDFTGPGSVTAAQMAVDDFGGTVLGRPVKVISGDHQLKPDVGAAIARRWYDEAGVSLIVDVPVSAVGLAVQGVAREKKKLFVTSATLASDFIGKFCSPYTMQWVFNTTALANGTVRTMLGKGAKTWYFITADYAFGAALERDSTTVINQSGGTVVGSVRHPFNTPDLTSFVVRAMGSDAQVIALADGPPDNVTMIKEANEFGLDKSTKSIVSLFMVINDVHALGLRSAQNLILTSGFYWDIDEQTRTWSKRFFDRMGKMPSAMQASDYSSVSHWLKAVKAAGTLDADAVGAAMRATPVEDMFARHGHLRVDGALVHDLYLVQVKTPAESKGPWDYYKILATIPGDEAFPRLEDEGCPLVTK